MLVTYGPAALGTTTGSTNTFSKSYTSTTKVSVTDGSGIQIVSGSSSNFPVGGGTLTTGNSTMYSQMNSTEVSNAIALQRASSVTFPTPGPGVIGNTVFIGLFRPTIQLSGPPSGVVFKLLKADLEFAILESTLAADLSVGRLFKPSTIRSFFSQYVPINDPSGSTLVKPRFKLRFAVLLDAGVAVNYMFSKSVTASASTTDTSMTSATIMSSTGFMTKQFQTTFGVGQTLSVQHVQASETTANKVVTLSTTLNRTSLGISAVYYDRVFKTFVVVDRGAPGPAVVQGKITDSSGNPIPNAAVSMTQNGTTYIANTNASGAYKLAAPANAPLAAGTVQVTSGGVSKTVTIGSTAVTANLGGVNPTLATSRQFEDLVE